MNLLPHKRCQVTSATRGVSRCSTSNAWALAGGAAALSISAMYPYTATLAHPFLLPGAILAMVVFARALQRPGLMVAVAFVLTALNPGLVGEGSWVPGLAWILATFGLVVARNGGEPHGRRLPVLSTAVVAYMATVVAAFALAPDRGAALSVLRSNVAGALLFFVAAWSLRTRRDVTTALTGASAAAVVIGGFATIQHLRGAATGIGFITSAGELVTRANGGFGHPNQLGGFLVLLVPLAAAAALCDRPRRALHLAAVILAVGGIYASFSRGALLALLVMPFFLVRWRTLLLAPLALLLLLLSAPALVEDRFTGEDRANVAGRTDIWTAATAIWHDRPVTGAGLASFPNAYAAVAVPGKQFLPDTRFVPPPHAHNLLLQLLAEQGLIGATAFAVVGAGAATTVWRLRASPIRHHALVAAAVMASLVGFFVQNVFDVTLLENAGTAFWGVLGILSALASIDARERATNAG